MTDETGNRTADRAQRQENDLAWVGALSKADMKSALAWLCAYDQEAIRLLRERLANPISGT